jgi:hypothetical protein
VKNIVRDLAEVCDAARVAKVKKDCAMLTKRSHKAMDSKPNQGLESFVKALEKGHCHEALELFLKDQAHEIFPKGHDTLKWLTHHVGKKASTKFVEALACLACFDCKKGLRTCDNCQGAGHLEHEIICESCLGFASISCDFCGGTGLASIDFIPSDLRLAVFAVRLENAEKHIADLLKKTMTSPPTEDLDKAFDICVNTLFDLNRHISVLESAVGVTKDMIEVPRRLENRVSKIRDKAVRIAIMGEKRLGEIVSCLVRVCERQAENEKEGKKTQMLMKIRKKFYSSMLHSTPRFAGTYLEHSVLNEAAKKFVSKKKTPHGA